MKEVHWSPVLKQSWHRETAGRSVRHWSQFQFGGLSSPFLNLDHFRTLGPIFPPHPHAGFSAVTYLLDRSPGGLRNRDSLGGDSPIEPGGLHWTLAGSGLLHEETPLDPNKGIEGFQVFVNLKETHKLLPPRSLSFKASELPTVRTPSGATIKICAGSFDGVNSPLALPEETDFWDIALEAGASFPLKLRPKSGGLLYAVDGTFTVDCASPFSAGDGGVVAFRVHEAVEVTIRARGPGRMLLLQGLVTDEPLVFQGPFAMTSEEGLIEAVRRYQSGEMGKLDPSI